MAVSIMIAVMTATSLSAEALPAASRLDRAVRVTPYVDGQVYTVRVALARATTIEFGAGEVIASVVAGDTESFSFEGVPGGRVVAIKPTAPGASTNVTIYTNQRSYYFRLVEGSPPFYVVRFTYPEQARDRARVTEPRLSTRRYGISARDAIAPARIWDDGNFTYFQFHDGAPMPAIFKVRGGFERSVNATTMANGVVRVSGLSRQWAVRLGQQEVCIVEMTNG